MPAKLSPLLKQLIKAPHARGHALPAPPPSTTEALFTALAASASSNGLNHHTWLTLSTAALVTLNSPESLCQLYSFATRDYSPSDPATLERAALIREAGLKCISFSGIPRTINSLGALRGHFPPEVIANLELSSTRVPTPENVFNTHAKALSLWNSIYEPHASKLLVKLAESHPDLPVHILNSHYGPLLSDPSPIASIARGKIGRILTSVVAISCLRAQQGVAPQVASHIYGLLNSGEPNSGAESEEKIEGHKFLTSDQGSLWVLGEVDRIVSTVAGEEKMFGGPKAAARL